MAILYRVSKLPQEGRCVGLITILGPLYHDEGFLLFHQLLSFEFPESIVGA